MNQLAFSRAIHQALRERLMAEDPELDERTLADTLEGLSDLHEVVAAIVRSALIDDSMAEGLRGRIGEMNGRLDRLEQRAGHRRQIARDVMVEAQIKKIAAPDLTISLRQGSPALTVFEERLIPPDYWVPREPRLNRQRLTADLKQQISIPGASLSNAAPIISVRVK